MNKKTIAYLVLICCFLFAAQKVSAWQSKQKAPGKKTPPIKTVDVPPGSQLISKAMNAKAERIANDFWEKRLTNCGKKDVYYIAKVVSSGLRGDKPYIKFIELVEPQLLVRPRLTVLSRADIMNGIEWEGTFSIYGTTRDYGIDFGQVDRPGAWSKYSDRTDPYFGTSIVMISLKVINGEVTLRDGNYFPVSCDDVAKHTNNKTIMYKDELGTWLKNSVKFEGKCFPVSFDDPLSGYDCSYYSSSKVQPSK